jgi:uncharacterized membrane protein
MVRGAAYQPPVNKEMDMSASIAERQFKPPRNHTPISDFLGGRALAWLGGIATLAGIVLLLALAISHGWIGREARIAMAAAASVALMLAGTWLHARRGRTEAAVAMVGTATAGWFATMVVASEVYHLIAAPVAIGGSMLAGAAATTLAIRWAGRAIAMLGLLGALLSPMLSWTLFDGAPFGAIVMLAVGASCAMWVVLWRRWVWLAFATVLVCAPQWLDWITRGHGPLLDVAVLAAFGALGLVGAVFAQLRSPQDDRLVRSAAALALLNAVILGIGGRIALGADGVAVWLGAIAVAHVGVALWRWPRIAKDPALRRLLIGIGVIVADVALGITLHGPAVVASWAAIAVAFAWLARRLDGTAEDPWLGLALGAHIGLVLARALVDLPPGQLSDGAQLVPLASVAIVAAACLGCARINGSAPSQWWMLLDALGLLAIGYLTAAALSGPAQLLVWALEAVTLSALGRRLGDPVARYGGLAFLGAATLHAVVVEGPASPIGALVSGADDLGSTAVAFGGVAAAVLMIGLTERRDARLRAALVSASGLTLLYLASVAIVTAFQPEAGADPGFGLGLDVPVRELLGGLLLLGAFAYQRLRPPPPPDLRTLHASQR